jgi:hypothetical protein
VVALELGKQLVRAGRERDEPGNGPPAVGLTTEHVYAFFRSLVLGAMCRKVNRRWSVSSLPRSQVRDLYSSFGSLLACLMSAETTVCVSLLVTFANIT